MLINGMSSPRITLTVWVAIAVLTTFAILVSIENTNVATAQTGPYTTGEIVLQDKVGLELISVQQVEEVNAFTNNGLTLAAWQIVLDPKVKPYDPSLDTSVIYIKDFYINALMKTDDTNTTAQLCLMTANQDDYDLNIWTESYCISSTGDQYSYQSTLNNNFLELCNRTRIIDNCYISLSFGPIDAEATGTIKNVGFNAYIWLPGDALMAQVYPQIPAP